MKYSVGVIVGTLFAQPVACGGSPSGTQVLASKDRPTAVDSEGFAAAPPSTKRAVLTLTSFDLEPGGEVYKCQTFKNPFDRDVAILQTQSIMSRGSHHLAVFRVEQNADGALEDCSGLEFHATIHAAQTPVAKTTFPDGIGAFLAADEGVRLNAHYVNLGTDVVHASVKVALDYESAEDVKVTAAQIYLNDSTLDIPPGTGSAGGTLALPSEVTGVKLVSIQSHMHRRAVHFQATLEDGTMLYETDSWNEPPVRTFSPPLSIADGARSPGPATIRTKLPGTSRSVSPRRRTRCAPSPASTTPLPEAR